MRRTQSTERVSRRLTGYEKLTVMDEDGNPSTDTVTVTAVSVDILVSPSELPVQEGGSSTYQVKHSESPRQEVSVIAFSDNENVVLENAQLTFNASNWDAWLEVRISMWNVMQQ